MIAFAIVSRYSGVKYLLAVFDIGVVSILLSWHNHLYIDSSDKKDSLMLYLPKFNFTLSSINTNDRRY